LKVINDIKKAVYESIMLETSARLHDGVHDEKKRAEILSFTRSRLKDILNTFAENELLPKEKIVSKQDFENHILTIIQ
jgi:hypothetical protein